jgi:hypothetical protein
MVPIKRTLCNPAFLCPLLASISNIFLALSLTQFVLFIHRYISILSIMFSNIIILLLKSSPHFLLLLLFPNTCHCLICFVHYFSDMCLIRGSFIEYVAQVFELFYSFYFPSFPVPLNLFTLPLSLVEHHHFDLLNIHFQLFLPHILS